MRNFKVLNFRISRFDGAEVSVMKLAGGSLIPYIILYLPSLICERNSSLL